MGLFALAAWDGRSQLSAITKHPERRSREPGVPACEGRLNRRTPMRNLTIRVLPIIIAAGLSGLMFTATLY